MNKDLPDWLNVFSDKSLKVLYNITFVLRGAFYAAVVVLLIGISQELIAIRFTLDSLERTMKRSAPKSPSADAEPASAARKSQ